MAKVTIIHDSDSNASVHRPGCRDIARGHLTSGRRAWARWMDWARTAGLILAAGTTAL